MNASAGLRLVLHPDPVLRRKAVPVISVDEGTRELALEMARIMAEEEGIGLAAPQVGRSLRVILTAAMPDGSQMARTWINPIVERLEGNLVEHDEGCLSLPEIRGMVRRPPLCVVRATDEHGQEFRMEAQGLLARCLQHEIDHLDGVLIIDRFTPLDRLANRRKLKQLEAGG